ncbi:InaA protein [hydrothermal vent metagenome]|uniref:InaA protein n=1 Tax=hydrothermal vent metagenome TaxID=652676 RepID=A0A3B1AHY2_9ZZZZ
MQEYVPKDWAAILRHNGFKGFEALWSLEADWFEPPNKRRGGWSGVVRLELERPDGETEGVFIKRQENHQRRTLRHPLAGEPTFAGEMKNILMLQKAGVPTLDLIYFGQREVEGSRQAILVTRELSGFYPLNWWLDKWLKEGWAAARNIRLTVIDEMAQVVRQLHENGLVHNSLHPKHLFVRVDEQEVEAEVRLIDLEKMRSSLSRSRATSRDLDSLNRRCLICSHSDRLRFLKHYLGLPKLDAEGRALWRYLVGRKVKKT